MPEPTRYVLTLVPLPSQVIPVEHRLRQGLKYLLRACGLRCESIEEVKETGAAETVESMPGSE